MAQLAVGAVAGAAGFLVAGPVGLQVGLAAGTVVGGLLFPPKAPNGPRLGDLTVTGSTYGGSINILYGTCRVNGNIIWAEMLDEVEKKGGKSLGGGSSQNTFNYYFTAAVAFCEGPCDKVTRIWANGTLIYDITQGSDYVKWPQFQFTFYGGREDQLPDPTISANIGTGGVPGYKGICYILFERCWLYPFGNSVPNFTAEISKTTAALLANTTFQALPAGPLNQFTTVSYYDLQVDPINGNGYLVGTEPLYGLIKYDISTMQEELARPVTDILILDPLSTSTITQLQIDAGGWLYGVVFPDGPGGAGTGRISRFDAESLDELAYMPLTYGAQVVAGGVVTTMTTANNGLFGIVCEDSAGANEGLHVLICLQNFQTLMLNGKDMSYISGLGLPPFPAMTPGAQPSFCLGLPAPGKGVGWFAFCGDTTGAPAAEFYIMNVTVTDSPPQYATTQYTFSSTDFDTMNANGFLGYGDMVYDAIDDSLILQVQLEGGDTYISKWAISAGGIVWTTKLPGLCSGNSNSITEGGAWLGRINGTNTFLQVDLNTGTLNYNVDWSSVLQSASGEGVGGYFDSDSNYMIVPSGGTSNLPTKVYLGRATPEYTTLSEIYSDVCSRVNYEPGDYDTSDLTDEVTGYVISRPTTASDLLDNFNKIFLINTVERDYGLVFEHRGKGTRAVITQDEMIRSDDKQAEPYSEARQQEIELPFRVSISYMLYDYNYQIDTQSAQRVHVPQASMYSANKAELQLAAAVPWNTAKSLAEGVLWTTWENRHTYKFRAPWTYLYLDAGDSIQLTFNDGASNYVRLNTFDMGADLTLEASTMVEGAGIYTYGEGITTGAARAFPQPQVFTSGPSQLYLMDTPLLRDQDDDVNAIVPYWAAGPYRDASYWMGTELDTSPDNSTWTVLGNTQSKVSWGYLLTAPADPGSPFHTQGAGTFQVFMMVGGDNLSSISDLQLANGLNGAMVLKANGEVEILQFRDVTVMGANQFQLSFLNRGRRGTDTMAKGLLPGDNFVLLTSGTVFPLDLALGTLNTAGTYRALTSYQLPEKAASESFTPTGRDKMPYAPVHLTATLSGSDIDLAWVRRSRINGALTDLTGDVPLAEATEAYSVDILKAGTVVRTLTSTTSSVTYPSADISTDFGSTPTELSIVVYQISAIVGRGFGAACTLGVM